MWCNYHKLLSENQTEELCSCNGNHREGNGLGNTAGDPWFAKAQEIDDFFPGKFDPLFISIRLLGGRMPQAVGRISRNQIHIVQESSQCNMCAANLS